jgi:DNA-binding PadR family transcriptional regulator
MTLGPLQQALLTVLYSANTDLAAIDIYQALLGKYDPLSPASIFITLDRMGRKGFVKSRKGHSLSQRGGKARLLYKITAYGRAQLRQTEDMQTALSKIKETSEVL